jgi:hypothetical protein
VKLSFLILEKETEKELDKEREKEQEVESPQQRPRKSFGALTSKGKCYRINSLAYLYASAKKKRFEEPKDLDQRKKGNAAVLLYFNENQGKIECVVSKKYLVVGKTTFLKVWLTWYATLHLVYSSHFGVLV